MRTFLFIFIFSLSLNAESMYNGKCVNTYSIAKITLISYNLQIIYSDNTIFNFVGSASSLDVYLNVLTNNDGLFVLTKQGNTVACGSITKNNTLGMTNEQYNFMMALSGVLIGSLILFFILGI